MKPAPYPADTRAKGWRFELDHERIEQSATWALAPAEARPWLLMLWLTAWKQTPCGSLDADDAVICARIGMPPKLWAKHRAVLMRGWWKAEDGRLYHDPMTGLVMEMLGKRRSEADRKALQRSRTQKESRESPSDVPRDKGGTPAESDTRTDHQNQNQITPSPTHAPTEAARVCRLLKAQGVSDVNPGHPDLRVLLEAGATDAEFGGAAAAAAAKGKGFAYTLGTLKRQRQEAANAASTLHRGRIPNKQESLEARNRAIGEEWARQMMESQHASE